MNKAVEIFAIVDFFNCVEESDEEAMVFSCSAANAAVIKMFPSCIMFAQ